MVGTHISSSSSSFFLRALVSATSVVSFCILDD